MVTLNIELGPLPYLQWVAEEGENGHSIQVPTLDSRLRTEMMVSVSKPTLTAAYREWGVSCKARHMYGSPQAVWQQ